MLLINPFNNDLFTAAELTDAINAIPNQYGRLGEMGLFTVRGVATDTVTVEERGGVLRLLPSKQRARLPPPWKRASAPGEPSISRTFRWRITSRPTTCVPLWLWVPKAA